MAIDANELLNRVEELDAEEVEVLMPQVRACRQAYGPRTYGFDPIDNQLYCFIYHNTGQTRGYLNGIFKWNDKTEQWESVIWSINEPGWPQHHE